MLARYLLLAFLSAPIAALAAERGTVVRMETTLGNIEIELFDDVAPKTVANFLKYIEDGDYTNSFFHRSVPGFVIQGGGFTFANNVAMQVPVDPPIVNEFSRSNLRGTIAMAKLANNPNSATSQWFFNLRNNASSLDGQNGGFTVFGQVLGDGMQVVDAIAALPVWNAGGALTELPLRNYSANNPVAEANLIFVRRIVPVVSSRRMPWLPLLLEE